ncbi:hypothetical protein A1O1_06546 [Capronia coronata CBS 617.96]|uniref:Uncharacterized protein n=1 Tax=Capronia coronata CBS 617.96 TaxID=1182541 RepID=W9YA86_9EURO|nr:uncharacterized protein A1O1_06546 [Capronia coronata CBS 617.96]EXJ86176.1 hypothetical protein A1O1_06546 [Capronia coronata CBS 617.96]
MASFTSVISILSAVMLYVQQKSSEYLILLNLKTSPFFQNVLTLGASHTPSYVTRHVTTTFVDMKTITATPWSTVTSATTVYVKTPQPTAAYTAIVTGHFNQDYGIVTTMSPWQLHHILILLFVIFWVPLIFLLTKLYHEQRVDRLILLTEYGRGITEEYHRKPRELERSIRRPLDPYFLDTMYTAGYIFLWRRSRDVQPYIEKMQDVLSVARDAVLGKLYQIGKVLFDLLMGILTTLLLALFNWLYWAVYQTLWLLDNLFFFWLLPICVTKCLHLKDVVVSLIQEKAVEPLAANIKTRAQDILAFTPETKTRQGDAFVGKNSHDQSRPSTPRQPNHFEVPYSTGSPDGMVLVDRQYYEDLVKAATKSKGLAKALEIEKLAVKNEHRDCADICHYARKQQDKAEFQARQARHELREHRVSVDSIRKAEARAARAEAALEQERALRQAAEEGSSARQACLDEGLLAYSHVEAELRQVKVANEELERQLVDLQAVLEMAMEPALVTEAAANQPAPEVQGDPQPEPRAEEDQGTVEEEGWSVPMGPGNGFEVACGGFEELLEAPLTEDGQLEAMVAAALAAAEGGEAVGEAGGASQEQELPMEFEQSGGAGNFSLQPQEIMDGLEAVEVQPSQPTSCGPSLLVAEVPYLELSPEMDYEMEEVEPGPVRIPGLDLIY